MTGGRDPELEALRKEVAGLRADVERLTTMLPPGGEPVPTRAELDTLKSSREVAAELRDEFELWRAANPPPDEPLVSVCVATFDRADLLVGRCLPSILAQSYERLEVIVVGDRCTDDSAERVAALADPRVTWLEVRDRPEYPAHRARRWMVAGGAAMNAGLAQATGDWITHLDDDDEFLPSRIEKLVRFAADQQPCDVVFHPFFHQHGDHWVVNEAREFGFAQVTTSSVMYRSWFTRLPWDLDAHQLDEPGDWNRFRRFAYTGAIARRFPEPLLRHYAELGNH
jgi:hypothetical protein